APRPPLRPYTTLFRSLSASAVIRWPITRGDQQPYQPAALPPGGTQPRPGGAVHHLRRQRVTASGHALSAPATTDKTSPDTAAQRSEEHTSELQSRGHL